MTIEEDRTMTEIETATDSKTMNTITLDYYQYAAAKTAIYPGAGTWQGLAYTALGGAGETGEIAEHVKKMLRDDGGVLTPERRAKLSKEIGDRLWYLAMMCRELGLMLGDVAEENLYKLADRKARGVLQGSGSER